MTERNAEPSTSDTGGSRPQETPGVHPPYSSPYAPPYAAPIHAGATDAASIFPASAYPVSVHPAPYAGPLVAPPPGRPERHAVRTSLALLLVAAGVGVGVVAGRETRDSSSLGLSTTQVDSGTGTGTGTGSGTGTGTGPGSGSGTDSGSGSGTDSGAGTNTAPGAGGGAGWGWGSGGPGGQTGDPTGAETPTVKATAAQQVGVVNINTVLKYQSASAAGTGMVLTSNGRVLTNNHVVNGATSIKVTVVSTGKTYTAAVVGTDASDDIAVVQLADASGLATAKLGTTAAVTVGQKVTGVGNAGGVGGTPSAATGTVTALNRSITASDEGGANAETLTGLIQNDANILAGDSGGPLYNSGGAVIGVNTAGASTNQYSSQDVSYAIPIAKAVTIADQIAAGKSDAKIHIGTRAFLGISVSPTSTGSGGAGISDVVPDGPAARAGIAAGDVITSIAGRKVTSATGLSSIMDGYHGGDKLTVRWTTAAGKAKHATITTIAGPVK